MARDGYDCVGGKAAQVRASLPLPDIMFWYGTGSVDVQWTSAEKELFPADILVEIDQGGADTPIYTAPVRDVEAGAWSVSQAVNRNRWVAERPTIYCDRLTLPEVIAAGWNGDIWLAWPGWAGETLPDVGPAKIIGVQDAFDGYYDHTTFLDASWPKLASPPPPEYALSVTIDSRVMAVAFTNVAGADHYIIEYTAGPGDPTTIIDRIPAPATGSVVHGAMIRVPGSHSGSVAVFAVVHSKQVPLGVRALP